MEGITILVHAEKWPGPVDISQEVTPLRVRINNNGGTPLRVRYNEFNLIGSGSESYSALPLELIEGEITVRTDVYDYPRFTHRNFAVAPYHSPLYPGIDPYPGNFAWDPYYYNTYFGYWSEIHLPTPAMRQHVIPEGVVSGGGNLEGWLFFEKVDNQENHVVFRTDRVDADTGRKFAEVRIPFIVE